MAEAMPMKADAGNWESAQAQAIGSVTMVIGDAYVLAGADKRPLEPGDSLFADEVVQTADGSQIHITFNDQTWVDMGSGSTTVLDSDIYSPQAPDDESATDAADESATDAETLKEALAAGGDPSALAPTAAGGANEDEGNSAVFVDRIGDQTEIDMTSLETAEIASVLTDAPGADDLLFGEKPEQCDPTDPEAPCFDEGLANLPIDPPTGGDPS